MALKKERGNFRPVYTAIWDDRDFQALDSDTKTIFFNLRTSRFGSWTCIYVVYPSVISEQTGISPKKVQVSLASLERMGWVKYTPPVIWIVKGLQYDPNWNPLNSKQVTGVENQLRSLPKNPLVPQFCEKYGLTFEWLKGYGPIDAPIHDPIDDPTDRVPKERVPGSGFQDQGSIKNIPAQKESYGEFVTLTSDEHEKLVNKFGPDGASMRIEKLNNYLGSKGKKYKSHYHTILVWESKNNPQPVRDPPKKKPGEETPEEKERRLKAVAEIARTM